MSNSLTIPFSVDKPTEEGKYFYKYNLKSPPLLLTVRFNYGSKPPGQAELNLRPWLEAAGTGEYFPLSSFVGLFSPKVKFEVQDPECTH